MTALISVIMPCYNNEKYIFQTISSICQQDFYDFEFIIINDGSTDSSLEIIKYFAQIDSRIKVYNKQHSNAGDSRNYGLQFASGEYILFIDSDDVFKHNFFSTMYSKAIYTDSDVVICSFIKFNNENGKTLWKYIPEYKFLLNSRYSFNEIFNDLFTLVPPNPWGKLIKRSIIFDNSILFQSISSCNDVAFTYSVLSHAKFISFCPEPLIYYRSNINNISANRGKVAENIVFALEELQNRLKIYGNFQLLKDTFINLTKKCFEYELQFCSASKKAEILNLVQNKFDEQVLSALFEDHLFAKCYKN